MLSCEEYQLLEEFFQAELLWRDGIFLMSRATEKLSVELFSLYNFYAEVFFDKTDGDPLYIKAFDNMDYLDNYLGQINIAAALEKFPGTSY